MENRKRSLCWSVFSKTESGKARCGLCEQVLSFPHGATSNLMRHIKMKHPDIQIMYPEECQVKAVDETTEDLISYAASEPPPSMPKSRELEKRKRSLCWAVFSETGPGKARCALCGKILSFLGGATSNLMRHVKLSHPDVQIIAQNENQTMDADESGDGVISCTTNELSMLMEKNKVFEKRKRSHCWSIFSKLGTGKVGCGLCGKILSFAGGATSNLMRHIKMKHPDVEISSQNECQTMNAEEPVDNAVSCAAGQPLLSLPASEPSCQVKITSNPKRCKTVQRSTDFDYQLVKMMVKEFHPFSLVDDEEFTRLIYMLNSSYTLPSKTTITSELVPRLYGDAVLKVRNDLNSVRAVSITTDGWTSVKNVSFVAVTVHFCDEDCELKSYLLDCFQYGSQDSADNLAAELKRVLTEWDVIDKISVVISDNTANLKNAVKECHWRHVPCFAHTVNLTVQAGIHEINAVHTKVKSVVEFFKCSPQATLTLTNSQKQMGYEEFKLKLDVPTRWSSTYEMFLRFTELKEPLLSAMDFVDPDLNQFSESDWLILRKACDILKIFQEVTAELSSETSVSLSKVILLSKALVRHVTKISGEANLPEEIKKMTCAMNQILLLRFAEVESNPVLAESTVLDPRFKRHVFQNEISFKNVCKSLQQRVTSMHSIAHPEDIDGTSSTYLEPTTSALWKEFDFQMEHLLENTKSTEIGVLELDKYLQEPNIMRKEDPLQWWKHRKNLYPNLYEIMKSRLSIPATSVPCERLFSKRGQELNERRKMLSSSQMSQIMFLNVNM